MTKTKHYILGGILLCLAVGITIASIKPAKTETTPTTFPVDEAGIAAYVKLDNIENIDINALAEALHSVERQAESYVIGTVRVRLGHRSYSASYDYPHVYIGMDGWIVAYYLKTEEASRIMQWTDYQPGPINTTTLKDAIDIISQKTGVTYSIPVKYYDFEFSEANKLTLIADRVDYDYGLSTNSFYVTVPGTLYEASYMTNARTIGTQVISLKIDDVTVLEKTPIDDSHYGYFDTSTYFKAGDTHHVTFSCGQCYGGGVSTILIYKN